MPRIVLRIIRAHLGATAVLVPLAAFLAAIAAAAPGYARTAAAEQRAAQLDAATPVERVTTVRGSVPHDGPRLRERIRSLRDQVAAAVPEPGLRTVTTVTVEAALITAGPVQLADRDGACEQLTFTGACPAAAGDVLIPDTAGHTTGDVITIRLTGTRGPTDHTLRVTGVYATRAAETTYYLNQSTMDGLGEPTSIVSSTVTLELVAADAARLPADLGPLREALAGLRQSPPPGFTVTGRTPELFDRIRAGQDALTRGLTTAVGSLVLTGGFVLLLALRLAATARRPQATLGLLRGVPSGRRWWFALGPSLLPTLAGGALGTAIGTDGADRPAIAGAILGGLAVTVAVAEIGVFRVPVLTGLRRTEPRGRTRPGVAEVLAGVVAAAAAYQLMSGATGIAALAAGLITLAVALLVGRAAMAAAAAIGAAGLRRGRLAAGLAAVATARRSSGARVFALVLLAVAGLVQAAAIDDSTATALRERAALELGADRVLHVGAITPSALRAAVHRADPDGRYALAAARDTLGPAAIVAVEADRLETVTGVSIAGLAAAYPQINAPITITGGRFTIEATITADLVYPATVIVAATRPDGMIARATFLLGPAPGPATAEATLDGCADGCRLAYLGFDRSPERVHLHEVRSGDTRVLGPADLAAAGRWRAGFTTSPTELTVLHGDDWLSARYVPDDPRHIVTDLRVLAADTPVPLPVLAAGPARLAQSDEVTALPVLGGDRPVSITAAQPGLPGAGDNGYLMDLTYADRLAGTGAPVTMAEVWLAADTPDTVVTALRAALPITGEDSVEARMARMRHEGPGRSALLYLLAAAAGVLLAAAGVGMVTAAEHRTRTADLQALRVQGLIRRDAHRSRLLGPGGLVVAAAVAGVATGLLTRPVARAVLPAFAEPWTATPTDPPATVTAVFLPAALATAILLAVALATAARRTGGSR